MVKKKFIDKKKAVTYSLVYRSTEDEDDSQDAPPPLDALPQRRYPPGHPLAWLEEQELQGEMSDTRRQELIDLGFPDDGYDYLRHMRTLGHGKAGLEGAAAESTQPTSTPTEETPNDTVIKPTINKGINEDDISFIGPSVFLPATTIQAPSADVALFDATALTVSQQTEKDEDTTDKLQGISAFARKRDADSAHGVVKKELDELEEMMRQIEEEDMDEGGDLLDDFVLTATQHNDDDDNGGDNGDDADQYHSEELYTDDDDDDDYEYSDDDDEDNQHRRAPSRGPGSIASTYWREDRTDRRNLLTVIDEQFEHLALEYDDDEIGDMEDDAEEGKIQGSSDVSQFQNILDEFIQQQHARGVGNNHDNDGDDDNGDDNDEDTTTTAAAKNKSSSTKYTSKKTIFLQREMEAYGMDNSDAAVAARMAKEAIRRAEELGEDDNDGDEHRYIEVEDTAMRERWDCESVLSLRSNIYNHPGTISEAPRRQAPAKIRLNKAGIPIGALSAHRYGDSSNSGGNNRNDDGDNDDNSDSYGDNGGGVRVVQHLERKKGETAEEKKARKALVKQAKRDARVAKKELKILYKEESVKAQRRSATAQVQPSVLL